MGKRYRKMAKKANGRIKEIRDGQVVLEQALPIADVLRGLLKGCLKRWGL